MTDQAITGVLAGFSTAGQLTSAVRRAHQEGFRDMEAYTPFPVEELDEYLRKPVWLPLIVLGAGIIGALTAVVLQGYIAIWDYPTNIGGRPLNSWPAFVIVTFELTILFAASAAFFGTLFFAGLPAPYHPLANSDRFASASSDRFFLWISSGDRHFHPENTRTFLHAMEPESVEDVLA